jgi:NDP-sugar pyrophosphorylase family protein
MAPQVRLQSDERKTCDAKPIMLDFLFNGRLNMGIVLALNLNAKGIGDYLKRFDKDYKRLKDNGFVLHFDTERDSPIIDLAEPYNSKEVQNRIYTYIKKKNALYCGGVVVQQNASRYISIPSPPVRGFSTASVSRLSRAALKLL